MTAFVQVPPPDSVRRVLHDVFAAPEYDWSVRVGVLEWLRARWDALLAWFRGLEGTHPTGYYALVVALTLLLVGVLAHFTYVFWRAFRPVDAPTSGAAASLPAPRDAAWHLRAAGQLAAQGRYTEALAQRFLALVLHLSRRHALVFGASKTPAEYAAEVRLVEAARGRFSALTGALYQHLFGGSPCTADDWARFDREARDLEDAHAAG